MRTMCNERVPRGLRYIAGDPAPASAPPPAPAPIPKCDNCRTFDFLICDGAEPCGNCEDIGYAFGCTYFIEMASGESFFAGIGGKRGRD